MNKSFHQSILCLLLTLYIGLSLGQRVAPGVPPQHYQQPPQYNQHQQHYQPPPPQYQQQQNQIPLDQHQQQQIHQQQQYHHQQVPVQNVDQYGNQIHHQQQPQQHHQPHEHQGHHPQQVLHTGNLQMEKEHIAEHMEVPIDTSKMSDQELQFHYFKMHDADNNNKLDGCELIKSLIHWHAQGNKEQDQDHQEVPHGEEKVFTDEELNTLIDPILSADDLNHDGFIDYPEFIRAQQKAAASNQQNNQNR